MRHLNIISFLLILVFIVGCARDFEYHVSSSVFINDSQHPGLPIYSEKGYNSFGVYWGLSPFSTQFSSTPSKVVVQNDSCHIHFSGSVNSHAYTLAVSLPGYIPTTFSDLLSLEGKQFKVPSQDCTFSMLAGNRPLETKILDGEFTIKRAQNMYIDLELESAVLSGTFSFKATVNGETASFSSGRFDMRFGYENFFYLQEE